MNPHSAHPWKLFDFVDDGATSVGMKLKTFVGLANVDKEYHIPKCVDGRLIVKKNPKHVDTSIDTFHVKAIFGVPTHILDMV